MTNYPTISYSQKIFVSIKSVIYRFFLQHKKFVDAEDSSENKKGMSQSCPFYFPGNGFEPLLDDPESSVLPLDDPGLITTQL